MLKIRERLEALLGSGTPGLRRPVLDANFQSNVKGLHIIGDLAGAPVIKLAMAQGVEVVEHIASLPEMSAERRREDGEGDEIIDILVVGAGAAGLNAALAAADRGLRCIVLEKCLIANTIENFPEGKWVYAEPDSVPPKGKLWLDGATKEDLIERWHGIVEDNGLDVRTEEPLRSIERHSDGTFTATSSAGTYRTRKIVLATGQRGNPRKLGVPGEESERVYHRLYSPRKYEGKDIVVVGGGNSAAEAALVLAERNRVVMSYRGSEFTRLFKDNREALQRARDDGSIEVVFDSEVTAFEEGEAVLEVAQENQSHETRRVPCDHAFVLVGAEVPVKFLRSLGIRLENEWTGSLLRAALLTIATFAALWLVGPSLDPGLGPRFGVPIGPGAIAGGLAAAAALAGLFATGFRGDRWSWLGISFLVWYTIYGVKVGKDGEELWPFKGWGHDALSFFDRPWAFWYTVLYTALMTIFGFQALKRWGLDRKDKFQIWRFASLLGFQWVFFFIIPEFLFQMAVRHQWIGSGLASDPNFAGEAWRAYGIVYAWPLFFYTFFYDPHMIWVVWGVLLTFVIIPIFVLFQGKRYCSWICGCGGLAETFGDRWRHLAPKGRESIRWEVMNLWILILAVVVTLGVLGQDVITLIREPSNWGLNAYRIMVDVWLVGILPVTLYPFLGGKVWCRYWCPLAKIMQLQSRWFTKFGVSKFHIEPNDKCIACNECSRYCQVGIDVMSYALKQDTLDNGNSSCIGCGICVTACPMDVLSFRSESDVSLPVLGSSSSSTSPTPSTSPGDEPPPPRRAAS